MTKRNVRIAIGVVASALFIAIALRGIDWQESLAALVHARYAYVIPIVVVTWWQLYIRAQRWRVVLAPFPAAPMRELVAATNIGWMANYLLPLRAGEIIRPVLLSRSTGLPVGGVIATTALERIFDLFAMLVLFGFVTLTMPVPATVRDWGIALLLLAAVLIGIVVFIRWHSDRARAVFRWALQRAPDRIAAPIQEFLEGFILALAVLDRPATLLRLAAWSLYLWLAISFMFGLGLLMFGLQVPLLSGQILVTVVTAVAVAAPSAPGFIGSFQLGCRIALVEILGLSESSAIAYSVALHLLQFVAVIAAGAFSLAGQGLRLGDIGQASDQESYTSSSG